MLSITALCEFQPSSEPTSSWLYCCCQLPIILHCRLPWQHLNFIEWYIRLFKHISFGTKDFIFLNYKTDIQTRKLRYVHPLKVQKLLGRAKHHNFYRMFTSIFKIPFTQCAYSACRHSLKASRKQPPGLLECFGLHCSGQMSSSLTMPTQTCGGRQEAEPTTGGCSDDSCWAQRWGHLPQSAEVWLSFRTFGRCCA